MDDFYIEMSDSGQMATISSVSELLKKIPLLVEAQTNSEDLERQLKSISNMFKEMSGADDVEVSLKKHLLLLEAGIQSSEEKKDKYLQLLRAEREIVNIQNAKVIKKNWTKQSALRKESIAIRSMRKELVLTDIADYMNRRYDKEIKKEGYAPFNKRDISVFLKPSEILQKG